MHNLPVVYVYLKFIVSILCEKHKTRVYCQNYQAYGCYCEVANKDSAERCLASIEPLV